MQICYNVTLKKEKINSSISYWADSFSVDEHRVLRVKSKECGDITVSIQPNEKLIVEEIRVKDDFDDIYVN